MKTSSILDHTPLDADMFDGTSKHIEEAVEAVAEAVPAMVGSTTSAVTKRLGTYGRSGSSSRAPIVIMLVLAIVAAIVLYRRRSSDEHR